MLLQNKRDDIWPVVARCWLDALEETARDFHGTRPRKFCMRAYRHATEQFLRILESEYGMSPEKATTIKGAIESYIDLGVKTGFFEDSSLFEIKEINPNKIEISVISCPYRQSCKDLLDQGFSLRDLTCARIGCFRAAVEILTDIRCSYEVLGIRPEEGCEGVIERI